MVPRYLGPGTRAMILFAHESGVEDAGLTVVLVQELLIRRQIDALGNLVHSHLLA